MDLTDFVLLITYLPSVATTVFYVSHFFKGPVPVAVILSLVIAVPVTFAIAIAVFFLLELLLRIPWFKPKAPGADLNSLVVFFTIFYFPALVLTSFCLPRFYHSPGLLASALLSLAIAIPAAFAIVGGTLLVLRCFSRLTRSR